MVNITYIDNYAKLFFQHHNGHATIYLELPFDLPVFQIEMIENFFNRIMFFCATETYININIERLKNTEVMVVAYFYNKDQNYDFSGTFEKTFLALHHTLTDLFDLSINNQHTYTSINTDFNEWLNNENDDDDSDDEEDYKASEYYNQSMLDDQDEEIKPLKKEVSKRLAKLGQSIDAMLQQFDHQFKDQNPDKTS